MQLLPDTSQQACRLHPPLHAATQCFDIVSSQRPQSVPKTCHRLATCSCLAKTHALPWLSNLLTPQRQHKGDQEDKLDHSINLTLK